MEVEDVSQTGTPARPCAGEITTAGDAALGSGVDAVIVLSSRSLRIEKRRSVHMDSLRSRVLTLASVILSAMCDLRKALPREDDTRQT